jgi:hypothetical protein
VRFLPGCGILDHELGADVRNRQKVIDINKRMIQVQKKMIPIVTKNVKININSKERETVQPEERKENNP